MTSAVERLEKLLDDSENEVRKLKEQLEEIRAHRDWDWARHTTIDKADDPLPTPRLEMHAIPAGWGDSPWYQTEWMQVLVHEHFLGHRVCIPIGHTKVSGGHGQLDPLQQNCGLPYRDGAHFKYNARTFGWPAFVLINGRDPMTLDDYLTRCGRE